MSISTSSVQVPQSTKGTNAKATTNPSKAARFKKRMCGFVRAMCRRVLYGGEPSRRGVSEMTAGEKDAWTFGDVRKIEEEKLVQLAKKYLGLAHGDCVIAEAKEGSYNRVNIMLFTDGTKCTVLIPAHGTVEKWTKEDAFALRSQALIMMLIKRKTNVPVPEVIAYNNSCENELGAPYMLTSFLEGKRVCDVWGDELDRITRTKEAKNEAMRLRILQSFASTMSGLRVFFFEAAGGLHFEHDLDDNPIVGLKFELEEPGFYTRKTSLGRTYRSTHAYLEMKLEEWWESLDHSNKEEDILNKGRQFILELALDCVPGNKSTLLEEMRAMEAKAMEEDGEEYMLPEDVDEAVQLHPYLSPPGHDTATQPEEVADVVMFTTSDNGDQDGTSVLHHEEAAHAESSSSTIEAGSLYNNIKETDTNSIDPYEAWLQATCETFVIKPPDVDWQNILVDDNGNITGLLDWDGVCTVPQFQGFASTPEFLQQDYLRTWHWEGDGGCSDHDLARYRKAHANFMAEAMGNKGDCIYTAKSPLLDVF